MDLAALSDLAAWTALVLAAAALVVALRTRPRAAEPRLVASVAGARHARRGPDSVLACVVELRNEGDAPAVVHVAEAELEGLRAGEAGLRRERALARVPLSVVLRPGGTERRRVEFPFPGVLVEDQEVAVVVRAVHERGEAEARGASRP